MPEHSQEARDLAEAIGWPLDRSDEALIDAALARARQAGRDEALAPFRAARARALVRARKGRMRFEP